MARLEVYNEAPYQGVSQAPAQVRLPTQCEALEDQFVVIPEGDIKRPPFTYLAKLKDHPGSTDGLFELLSKPEGDYVLTLTKEGSDAVPRLFALSGLPMAYDVDGLETETITVSTEAQTYLDALVTPTTSLRALTVVDYTFLVNRAITVQKRSGMGATAATRDPEAIIWIKQSQYARTYTVTISPLAGTPVTATLKTPSGASPASAEFIDTDKIAAALISGSYTSTDSATVSGNLAALSGQGYTVTRIGGVIHITGSTQFTVKVEDGQGGTAMIAVKDLVQRFSDLPQKNVDGFTVRITQESGEGDDDFFVKFTETAGEGTGIYEETIGPGAELGIDPETMPVGLFNDGAWKLETLDWSERLVGDQILAPDPDFVGRVLEDLTYWRGRVALISGEGVTLSAADNPFRIYPASLSTQRDDDPVTLLSPYPNVSTFRYGIPFDERLLLFGDISQASVSSQGTLGPATARIDVLTTYEFSEDLRPQPSNGKLYFAAPRGTSSSSVYELEVDKVADVTDADDLTMSVPRYVPSGLDRVANCPVNYMMVYGKSGTAQLIVHLFRYADGQRVQNAWKRWNLPEGFTLGGMFFKNTRLYLLAVKDGAAHLLMLDTAAELLDEDSARLLTHLDFRMTEDQVVIDYDPDSDRTLLTLPYDRIDALKVTVRAPGGNGGPHLTEDGPLAVPEGAQADVLFEESAEVDDNQVVLNGDWTGAPLWIGITYAARTQLSRIYAMGQDNRPLRSGRLSLRRLRVDMADTGYLRVEVTTKGRATRSYKFEGVRLDDPESIYNQPPRLSFTFSVPLMGWNESTEIVLINDSHFGSKVLGFAWEGELNQRAMRQ